MTSQVVQMLVNTKFFSEPVSPRSPHYCTMYIEITILSLPMSYGCLSFTHGIYRKRKKEGKLFIFSKDNNLLMVAVSREFEMITKNHVFYSGQKTPQYQNQMIATTVWITVSDGQHCPLFGVCYSMELTGCHCDLVSS